MRYTIHMKGSLLWRICDSLPLMPCRLYTRGKVLAAYPASVRNAFLRAFEVPISLKPSAPAFR